jgi:hypothetical protein
MSPAPRCRRAPGGRGRRGAALGHTVRLMPPAYVKPYVKRQKNDAARAAQLTARLLAFSRQQPLAPQPLDANRLVGGMSELLRRSIKVVVPVDANEQGAKTLICFASPRTLAIADIPFQVGLKCL